MVAVVSIPTVHLRRFEEVLDLENIMRTRAGDCQAARGGCLLATDRRVVVELARRRYISPSFQREYRSKRGHIVI
jgi:hypothetical protein